jgi:hypothetical protein
MTQIDLRQKKASAIREEEVSRKRMELYGSPKKIEEKKDKQEKPKKPSHVLKFLGSFLLFFIKNKLRIGVLILLTLFSYSIYIVYQKYFNPTEEEKVQRQEEKTRKDILAVLKEISKYTVLPENDPPTLFVIDNAEKLGKQQPFFANALNGDKLLIFPNSSKAILWSPSRGKIINIGPVEKTKPNTKK